MPFAESQPFRPIESEETLGHQIENKVAIFLRGSFDCLERIESTRNNGANDKKGIDLILEFENGDKMAIDVTADVGERVDAKIKSMNRAVMVAPLQEQDLEGRLTVARTRQPIPRAIIRVDMSPWEEYHIEAMGSEVIVSMPEKVRLKEEKDILQQLLRQIDYFSSQSSDYRKATIGIKDMLAEQLQEINTLESDFR